MRYAVVRGAESLAVIADYLPGNYHVLHKDPNGAGVIVGGEDDHGWTLEDYVIPRLQSGLMQATEVWPVFISEPVGVTRNIEMEMDVPADALKISPMVL